MDDIKKRQVRRALEESDIFSGLEAPILDTLIAKGHLREIKAGTLLFSKNDPGESFMVVLDGRIKISNVSADGKEAVLTFINPGEVLGEISVLDGLARTADATAIALTELFQLQRRDLIPLLTSNPAIAIHLIELLCHKLRRTSEMVEDNMLLQLAPRIAKGLLRLARESGTELDDSVRIDIKLSQRDLGGYVGIARENVNRQLKTWREEGLLEMTDGYIMIFDMVLLEEIAQG